MIDSSFLHYDFQLTVQNGVTFLVLKYLYVLKTYSLKF